MSYIYMLAIISLGLEEGIMKELWTCENILGMFYFKSNHLVIIIDSRT